MLQIPAATRSGAVDGRLHHRASCWHIQPTLPAVHVRLTDWYAQLDIRESRNATTLQTYTPVDSIEMTAQQRLDELEPTNREVRGIVSSDTITTEDLRAGLYDGAQVDEYLIDPRQPWVGYIDHMRYWIKGIRFDGIQWRAEVSGLAAWANLAVGELWAPQCRVELFSTKCAILSTDFDYVATVDTIVTQRKVFAESGGSGNQQNHAWGTFGKITWLTGNNTGHVSEIILHEGSGTGDTTLAEPTPRDIQVGDTGTLLPGCNKIFDKDSNGISGHCVNKFANAKNFQGEPTIPGGDLATKGLKVV